MYDPEKNWYVVYTKPRWEKKVHSLFVELGLETYCPLNRVRKIWSDRVKWVEEPLFKSYVFVKIVEDEKLRVRSVNGVVNFVHWLGKPAIVNSRDIEIIRRFLCEYEEVVAIPMVLEKGTNVTIRTGPLMDKTATVVKVYHNKVKVVIESFGYALLATVDRRNVISTAKQKV